MGIKITAKHLCGLFDCSHYGRMIIGILYIHPIMGTEDRLDAPTSGRFSILKSICN
nr:MAG TPA: hypothetical protein [Caudoviricetes sp.]